MKSHEKELAMNKTNDNISFSDEMDETKATCAMCGGTFDECEVNMIDYDIDLCVKCESNIKSGYFKINEPVMVREDFHIVAVYIPSEKEDNNAIMFGTHKNNLFPDSFKELGDNVKHNFSATYFDYPHRYSDDFSPEEMITFDSIAKYSRGEIFIKSGLVEFVSSNHKNTIYPEAIYGCKFTGKGITKIEDNIVIEALESVRRTWGV